MQKKDNIKNKSIKNQISIADALSKKIKEKNKGGRPTIYTEELGNKVCDAIKNSVRGLDFICKSNKGFPSAHTIREWLFDNRYPEFTKHYDASKKFQSDLMADEIIEVSYNSIEHHQSGKVDKAKLQVESLKWVASHLRPKKWSDKNKEEEAEERKKMTETEIADKLNSVIEKAMNRKNAE